MDPILDDDSPLARALLEGASRPTTFLESKIADSSRRQWHRRIIHGCEPCGPGRSRSPEIRAGCQQYLACEVDLQAGATSADIRVVEGSGGQVTKRLHRESRANRVKTLLIQVTRMRLAPGYWRKKTKLS
jgi:hypothetical protein